MTERPQAIVFRDFLFLTLLGFLAMVVWLLPHINPPGKESEGAPPPGNVLVSIFWPKGDTDIDLWTHGPGEIAPVGYSNKGGKLFNLLRDDLGGPDPERNFESAYSRGIVAGEYIVNLHLYRGAGPIVIDVEIAVNDARPGKASLRKIATTTVTLRKWGDERTALRFRLDAAGNLEAGSINSVFRPLRAANQGE